MKAILAILLLFTATLAAASDGAVSGGGGRVVICPGINGGPQSVQLLDLWEAKAIFNQKETLATGDLAADVNMALIALKNAYNNRYQSIINGVMVDGQDLVFDYMQIRAQMFLSSNDQNVIRISNMTFDLTDDADELGRPTGCQEGQVVVYDPNDRIYIAQDLYVQMSEVDQAALIAHEAFYAWLRRYSNETNSLRTRRAIGYVFSGNTFSLNLPNVPKGATVCRSSDSGLAENIIYLWSNGTNASTGRPVYSVFFNQVENTPLMGLKQSSFDLNPPADDAFFSNGEKCPAGVSHQSTFGFPPSGPEEFDRGLYFRFYCHNGTLTTSIIDTRPGAQGPTEVPVTCNF